jgi:hypothetical protein
MFSRFRLSPQVETIVGADVTGVKAFLKKQTMPALLSALLGGKVVGALAAAYLAYSYKESQSSRVSFA